LKEDILEAAVRLERAGEPFVLAIVVRAEKPTSAKPGDKAIIQADGTWIGWIGGSCAEPTVQSQARRALATGSPRLMQLSSTETCASGGSLDIYLEPHMPKPHLVVVGHHPVAEALSTLGSKVGFRVSVMSPSGTPAQFPNADTFLKDLNMGAIEAPDERYVVVASHGNYDAEALRMALAEPDASYVALVSSRKRGNALLEELDINDEQRARLKFPAGLDIGAKTPEEIALSILAEVISVRRSKEATAAVSATEEAVSEDAKDPICGMTVAIDTARYTFERNGRTYYFCSAGCKEKFINAD
jgi:xanthine dehydrogenase accessory factor